jgi:antimicrobial peptide system SdpB family protein
MKITLKSLPDILATFPEINSSKSIIGFSRSLLATGMLLLLIFNDLNFLIPANYLQSLNLHSLKFRFNFFLLFDSSHIVVMQVLALLILIVIISGYYLQVTSLLHFWISASLYVLNPVRVGGDNINMMLTLLLIPVCLFDSRKNHWNTPAEYNKFNQLIQNIFLFIIKLQVAFIYFDSLFDKLHVKEWLNGMMINYWFTHHFFGLHSKLITLVAPLLGSIPFLLFIAWGTMLFEAVLVMGLIIPQRFKLTLLKLGIIFHLSIMLVHGFASFFFAMSAALFLYLYPAKKPFSLNIILNEKY